MADYSPITIHLTKQSINGIISNIDTMSSLLSDIADLTIPISIVQKQMRELEKIVPSLITTTLGSSLVDMDIVFGNFLSTQFNRAISPIKNRLGMVPGVTETVDYITSALTELDNFQTLTVESEFEPDSGMLSLDEKTAVDLYMTMYDRYNKLQSRRNDLISNIKPQLTKMADNLKTVVQGRT